MDRKLKSLAKLKFILKSKKNINIKFIDKILNIEELVYACDIGVLFSNINTGEGLPNAVIEFMALSKPVIATDAGGTNELILDEINGFLVKNEESIIVQLVKSLVDNVDLVKHMGEKGRRLIENKFTLDRMGKKFVDVYEKHWNG